MLVDSLPGYVVFNLCLPLPPPPVSRGISISINNVIFFLGSADTKSFLAGTKENGGKKKYGFLVGGGGGPPPPPPPPLDPPVLVGAAKFWSAVPLIMSRLMSKGHLPMTIQANFNLPCNYPCDLMTIHYIVVVNVFCG